MLGKLINYFDVYGNKIDGYEVNNLCSEGTIYFKSDNKKDILKALKQCNFLKKHVRNNMLEYDDMGEIIEFSIKRDGYPLGRIEWIDE